MGLAVDILMQSLDPGRLSAFAHFDTFRSSQSVFYKVCKVSIKGLIEGAPLGEDNSIKNVLTKCITQTIF